MKQVLVSGSSGIVGYGVLRSLRQAGQPCFLVGTSIYDDSVAPAFCDVFEQAPLTGKPEYLDWLLATLRRYRIDLLIPSIEIDMYHWVEHVPEIRATGAVPLLNVPELIALCKDKWAFYQRLAAAEGVSCAIESSLEQDFAALAAQFGLPGGSLKLPFDPATGQFVVGGTQYTFNANSSAQNAIGLAGKLFGVDVLSSLDLGEKLGLVTTLSSPNLTALSGETADFLAGGEYPIPISQGLGTTSVEFKKFGVSLAYTPTVLANGRISIRVRPEVSELSSEGSITLNGFQVPALTVRRAETTVELGSGQSFMIAGLMSNSSQNAVDKMPGAGDIPILGSLFRSTSFRRGETELVIIVTPYLVNPVNANDIKLPTDGFQNPNDIQRLFGNMENDGKSGADRPKPMAAPAPIGTPKVGELDVPAAAPQIRAPGKKDKRKLRTAAASQDAAPGFSLN